MPLVVLGLSHRTAPVEVREQYAIVEANIPAALDALRQAGLVDEAVILSTCNRVEVYATMSHPHAIGCAQLREFLHAQRGGNAEEHHFYFLSEPQSIEHLFKVACGLDSMVLGETEILGQLKKAYDLALRHHHTGAVLNKAFQKAFHVAKHIRSTTSIQRGSVSVASVAVELAEKIFSELSTRRVMVIGAGDTSEKTARALVSRGVKTLLVTNRSYEKALVLAQELGGRPVPFDQWDTELPASDIVISCTAAPHYVLDRARVEGVIEARAHEPMLLIDIAVPRDIEPDANFVEGVYLYNIDDLQGIADQYLLQRKTEITRCQSIIVEKVRALSGHHAPPQVSTNPTPAFGP